MIIAFLNHHYLTSPPLPPGSPATDSNNWGILLMGFLSFYGKDFDYKTTGISISPGRSTFPLPLHPAPPFAFSYSHYASNPNPLSLIDDQIDDGNAEAQTMNSNNNDPLQFPLESTHPSHPHSHSLNSHELPTISPPHPFSITPPMFLEDPIRKGTFVLYYHYYSVLISL